MSTLAAAAFDSYLPAFRRLVPALLRAYDQAPATDSLARRLAEPIATLRGWDDRWGISSIPTSLAVLWGSFAVRAVNDSARASGLSAQTYIVQRATAGQLLGALAAAVDSLTKDFGTWKTPWGEINRFQRFNDEIAPRFDDAQPSIPVAFTSGIWGSLASFAAKPYPNTKRWYGSSGNSFLAVVEFADSVRAKAVTAGGESGNPDSPHFRDQAARYVAGDLRDVYFYRSQLRGHTERSYHPGE
jgi:acyl-homoserine-lactone acylase